MDEWCMDCCNNICPPVKTKRSMPISISKMNGYNTVRLCHIDVWRPSKVMDHQSIQHNHYEVDSRHKICPIFTGLCGVMTHYNRFLNKYRFHISMSEDTIYERIARLESDVKTIRRDLDIIMGFHKNKLVKLQVKRVKDAKL